MKKSDLIKEISQNLKALSVVFRYLEPVKQCRKVAQNEPDLNESNNSITLKPIRIDKYQTSTYLQAGKYFKPISKCIMPGHNVDETEETI